MTTEEKRYQTVKNKYLTPFDALSVRLNKSDLNYPWFAIS